MVLIVLIAGLMIGSFLNVCISRLTRGESIVFPASHCPRCLRTLTVWELIPVASYFWQQGKCIGCREKIPLRYPVVELVTAALFVLFFLYFSRTAFVVHAGFFSMLLVAFFTDLEEQIIPDKLVIALGVFAVTTQVFWPRQGFQESFIGAFLAGGVFLAIAVLSRGGMGGGDVKLMAVLGFWYGWQQVLLLMFLAFLLGGMIALSLLALKKKKRKDALAFGPFIIIASFLVTMWGKELMAWYLGLSGF